MGGGPRQHSQPAHLREQLHSQFFLVYIIDRDQIELCRVINHEVI